jgi:hypothetical protein
MSVDDDAAHQLAPRRRAAKEGQESVIAFEDWRGQLAPEAIDEVDTTVAVAAPRNSDSIWSTSLEGKSGARWALALFLKTLRLPNGTMSWLDHWLTKRYKAAKERRRSEGGLGAFVMYWLVFSMIFLDACLRSASNAVTCNNPATGLFVWAGMKRRGLFRVFPPLAVISGFLCEIHFRSRCERYLVASAVFSHFPSPPSLFCSSCLQREPLARRHDHRCHRARQRNCLCAWHWSRSHQKWIVRRTRLPDGGTGDANLQPCRRVSALSFPLLSPLGCFCASRRSSVGRPSMARCVLLSSSLSLVCDVALDRSHSLYPRWNYRIVLLIMFLAPITVVIGLSFGNWLIPVFRLPPLAIPFLVPFWCAMVVRLS